MPPKAGQKKCAFTRRVVKAIIGVFLLPLCAGLTCGLFVSIRNLPGISTNLAFFSLGILVYLGIHIFLHKPITTYVFGHELTHALWTILFGGKVKSFRATARGGSITSDKSNFWISLTPYFFPIYTSIIVISYLVVSQFVEVTKYSSYFSFAMGTTWAFHIVLTLYMVRLGQPDIRETGRIFSISFIYFGNLIVIAILVGLLSGKGFIIDFALSSAHYSAISYKTSARLAVTLVGKGIEVIWEMAS